MPERSVFELSEQDMKDWTAAAFRALGMLTGLRNGNLLLPSFVAQADEIIAAAEKARNGTAAAIADEAIAKAAK